MQNSLECQTDLIRKITPVGRGKLKIKKYKAKTPKRCYQEKNR